VNDLLKTTGRLATLVLMPTLPFSLLCYQTAFSHLNQKGFTGHGFFVEAITAGTVCLIFCGIIVFAAGRFCERHANELPKLLARLRSELPCRGEAGWRTKVIQLREDIESILSYLKSKPFGVFIAGVSVTIEKAGSFGYLLVYFLYYLWASEGSPNPFEHFTNEQSDPSNTTCVCGDP